MVDLAPKLSSGVAYNQPVQQPNAMESIANLFDSCKEKTVDSFKPMKVNVSNTA